MRFEKADMVVPRYRFKDCQNGSEERTGKQKRSLFRHYGNANPGPCAPAASKLPCLSGFACCRNGNKVAFSLSDLFVDGLREIFNEFLHLTFPTTVCDAPKSFRFGRPFCDLRLYMFRLKSSAFKHVLGELPPQRGNVLQTRFESIDKRR